YPNAIDRKIVPGRAKGTDVVVGEKTIIGSRLEGRVGITAKQGSIEIVVDDRPFQPNLHAVERQVCLTHGGLNASYISLDSSHKLGEIDGPRWPDCPIRVVHPKVGSILDTEHHTWIPQS